MTDKIREAFEAGFNAGAFDAAESGVIICDDFKQEVIEAAYLEYLETDDDRQDSE